MIVHDLDVLGACFGPDEADAPLVVDPDRMLAGAIALQGRPLPADLFRVIGQTIPG